MDTKANGGGDDPELATIAARLRETASYAINPIFKDELRKELLQQFERGEKMENDCLLCRKYPSNIFESVYFFAVYDDFPVREGYMLIMPIRHVEHSTDLSREEFGDLHCVIAEMVKCIKVDFQADGYNIGINNGEAAGQTQPHVHIHLIPRYFNDVPNPRGGIRNFLPNPLTEYP